MLCLSSPTMEGRLIIAATVCLPTQYSVALLTLLFAAVWSNFEIASLDLWRSPAYSKFFDFLDKKGGFYYEVRHFSDHFLDDWNKLVPFLALGRCSRAQYWSSFVCEERPDRKIVFLRSLPDFLADIVTLEAFLQRHRISTRTIPTLPPRRGSLKRKMLVWQHTKLWLGFSVLCIQLFVDHWYCFYRLWRIFVSE